MPIYLKSRIYLDFFQEDTLHDEYEKLLRNIFNRPLLKKPRLGTSPSYLWESEPTHLKTSYKVEKIRDSILKGSKYTKGHIRDFLDAFHMALQDYQIDDSGQDKIPFNDKVVDSIKKFLPYRDDFMNFIFLISQYDVPESFFEELHEFLQNLIRFEIRPVKLVKSVVWSEYWLDNYRFILYELFLYFISALIKFKKFELIDHFLTEPYFYKDNYHGSSWLPYSIFNLTVTTIDGATVDAIASLIKDRANYKGLSLDDLIQADFVLFLRSYIHYGVYSDLWHSRCIGYANEYGFEIFNKGRSKKYFNDIKILLRIKNRDDLKQKLVEVQEHIPISQLFRPVDHRSFFLKNFIETRIDKLDTYG